MPRSPRRSRSPEPPRRSSHRGASPSGTRYERSHASSSRRPDDRRPGRYDDDHERDRPRDKDRDRERERERDRDRDRDRYRDRSRERDTSDRSYEKDRYRGGRYDDDRRRRDDRDRDDRRRDERDRDDRRRDDRDDRRRDGNDRERDRVNGHHDSPRRDREPDRSPRPDRIASRSPGATRPVVKPIAAARLADSASPASSPGPQTEEEKQRLKRERLEAWKKARELEKLKDGAKANSATPEPEKKPDISKVAGKGALPPKPTGFSMGSLGRIGLPLKPGSAAPKRTVAALDADDAAPERKLQKLEDLPEFDPEVQSGKAASLDAIGDDMAAEDVDEEQIDVKPDVKPDLDTGNGTVSETANGSAANGHANGSTKMEVDEEEEEDELDKFMRENTLEVKQVNQADAKRQGLLAVDNESDDEPEVRDKQEDSLAKQEEMLQLAASKSRKKDLPTPDHSKIHYEPFRKAFYNPPIEALEMDEEEAELMRLEMDGIKVRGVDVPKPVKNWGAFGLPLVCLEQIRANGWTAATSIQAQAIPAIMSGRDVIGIAKTGSGKTIAFLLPLFRHVKDQRPVGGGEGPISIIMSPTRELAMQISRECKPFLKALNLRVSCCVGGQSISEDIASMKKGAEIVVCTPGRMIDLLTANNGRVTNLRRCTYLVLDEADRMFDMGFEPQVMKIINNIRPDAQKVLFSATFPKTMEALARKILVKPLEITVGGRSVVADTIDQRVEVRDQDSKFTRLLEILGEMSEKHKEEEDFRTLIFVDRQEWADDLFRDLLQRGYVCSSLHGGKEQVDRDEAIKNFKSGDIPIIVATSVAARGLDVPQLKLVINYDAPNHMEDYVHRAGRTGRAGNTGTCITFITPEQDKFSVDIVRALEASKAFIPPELKNMSDEFLEKIKAGKAKAAGSGFSGKGLERIERKREEKDRAEKHTYGDTSEALSLSSREGAVIPYKPKEQTNLFKPPERDLKNESDYTFTEIKVEIVNGPAPDKITNPALFTSGKNAMAQLPAQTLAALEKAKAEGRSVDAANLAKVVAKLTQSIELTKAEKFGLATAEGPKRTKDPDATDWHAVFPINDYPQKARWKVTNKEHMTLLSEISGASITMRGSYYSPGEEPKIGAEPKLYLLIESNDENKVRAAVDEIRRNLVEGSVAALNNADRGLASTSGRYAV